MQDSGPGWLLAAYLSSIFPHPHITQPSSIQKVHKRYDDTAEARARAMMHQPATFHDRASVRVCVC
jgi:hypothetical protein